MRQLDAYDPRAVFSDMSTIGEIYNCASTEACADAARAIMMHAARCRRGVSPLKLYNCPHDTTYITFEIPSAHQTMAIGEIPGLPIFSGFRQRFASMVPTPKQVRVDDRESYENFRDARRVPYFTTLEAQVDDGFASQTDADILVGESVDIVKQGGQKIDLPIEECRDGSVECWIDGPEMLCSVHLLHSDGSRRIATAGESCMRVFDELVSCASAVDVDPGELANIAPWVTRILGATGLIRQVLGAAHSLLRQEPPYVGVLESSCDPTVAAAMALIQRCWMGDRWACVEAFRLERACPELVDYSIECLQRARGEKS